MKQDDEHLRLLSIFHYVLGGLGALIACVPVIHLVIGILMVSGKFADGKSPPPPELGWVFIVMAVLFIVLGWVAAACMVYAGRCLGRRTNYTFCLVIAGIRSPRRT